MTSGAYPLRGILVNVPDCLRPQLEEQLSRNLVHVEAEFADLGPVLDQLSQAEEWTGREDATPRLLIIHVASSQDLEKIWRLRRIFSHQPVLVLLQDGFDTTQLVSGSDGHRLQVVSLPLRPDNFKAALNALARSFGQPDTGNRVVAVCGVTGGCGATTLALNIGCELASERRLSCLLVDLSFQMGMLAANLNIEPKFTIQDILKDVASQGLYAVHKALAPVADHLHLIAGPHRAVVSTQVQSHDVLEIIGYCRRLAEWTILDVPSAYDDLYFKILAAADLVVMVAEQRVPSIRAAKLICDRLCPGADPGAIHLVVNRYDPRIKGFRLADLEKLLPVGHLSSVANDPGGIKAADNESRPLRMQAPHSRALADIDALCETLVGKIATPAPTAADLNVLGRLARTFGLL